MPDNSALFGNRVVLVLHEQRISHSAKVVFQSLQLVVHGFPLFDRTKVMFQSELLLELLGVSIIPPV